MNAYINNVFIMARPYQLWIYIVGVRASTRSRAAQDIKQMTRNLHEFGCCLSFAMAQSDNAKQYQPFGEQNALSSLLAIVPSRLQAALSWFQGEKGLYLRRSAFRSAKKAQVPVDGIRTGPEERLGGLLAHVGGPSALEFQAPQQPYRHSPALAAEPRRGHHRGLWQPRARRLHPGLGLQPPGAAPKA